MSERIIVENRSTKSWEDVLWLVGLVIAGGRVSKGPQGPQYCWATVYGDLAVYSSKNVASDRFVAFDHEPEF